MKTNNEHLYSFWVCETQFFFTKHRFQQIVCDGLFAKIVSQNFAHLVLPFEWFFDDLKNKACVKTVDK